MGASRRLRRPRLDARGTGAFARVVVVISIALMTRSTRGLSLGRSMALDAVNPTTGPALGGTLVTVEGEGYAGSANAACAFDAVVVAPNSKTSTQMVCLSPRYADERGGFVTVGLTLRRSGRDASTAPVDGLETFNFAKQMTVSNAYPTDAPEVGGEVFYSVSYTHLTLPTICSV